MDSATNKFKGVGVALITPFKADGSVDYDALRGLVDWHLRSKVDFLCILGTTAETPCLTPEEKHTIREAVVRQVRGRVPLLMGCGGNCTRSVVEEIRHTDWTGIDGILSVCPMYNKPSQEGLYQHYRAISEASPLPVVLYNVPGRTGVNLTADTTLRLAHDFPNVVAVKEASGNLTQIKEILAKRPQGFDVISGDDSLTLQVMQAGGVGVISVVANAIPAEIARMVHLMQEGRLAEAKIINDELFELYSLMFIEGNPSGVKAALHALSPQSPLGLSPVANILRLPLVPVSERTEGRIRDILRQMQW
ncbi:MAG: 4-hydroxy-tetrahydrodipicolinate synthase [Bacteroidaceae bacterium]|nr:4-hydroxy-tetrahydrodipicolinate synthase [Bacteroidaceae bacterium]